MSKTVYLAGPIQFADDGGHGWRNRVATEFETVGIEWSDPLDKYDARSEAVIVHNGDPPENPPEGSDLISTTELVEADKELVAAADALLVGWDDVPSAGTPMEVLYAYERDTPVVVWYRGDSLSPWMQYHADAVFESLDDCVEWLSVEVATQSPQP